MVFAIFLRFGNTDGAWHYRSKRERAEWDEVIKSAAPENSPLDNNKNNNNNNKESEEAGGVSPLHPEILDSPQREIFEQLHSATEASLSLGPADIHGRLRNISGDLEFMVDQFAEGIHALSVTQQTAERIAEKSLVDAAHALEEREKQRAASGNPVDQMDALRGLARVLNSHGR